MSAFPFVRIKKTHFFKLTLKQLVKKLYLCENL